MFPPQDLHHVGDEAQTHGAPASSSSSVVENGQGRNYRLGEGDVSQWSDFLAVYLSPRSLNMINDYGFGAERRFDNYPFGASFFKNVDNVSF